MDGDDRAPGSPFRKKAAFRTSSSRLALLPESACVSLYGILLSQHQWWMVCLPALYHHAEARRLGIAVGSKQWAARQPMVPRSTNISFSASEQTTQIFQVCNRRNRIRDGLGTSGNARDNRDRRLCAHACAHACARACFCPCVTPIRPTPTPIVRLNFTASNGAEWPAVGEPRHASEMG